jgi:hypothetical protein
MTIRFVVPHKPDDLSVVEWIAILERCGQPTWCENLRDGTCTDPCGTPNPEGAIPLHVDHRHARKYRGESSVRNCRLICHKGSVHANLNRGAAEDARWQTDFWFDRRASFDQLRKTQFFFGPQLIREYHPLFIEQRQELLRYCSLLALTTGAGKTLLIISILLAINDEVLRRAGKAPRVGRVLYFVNEKALAVQLERELQDEVTRFGLHEAPPRTQRCTEPGDLDREPSYHDITIACPQALWERTNQPRSDSRIATILAYYDTIIWDECDFAAGQIDRLVRLAPHALKFGLTATPIDGEGDFLRLFAVAAIASYRQVFTVDRCLKIIPTWEDGLKTGFIRPVPHSAYVEGNAGQITNVDGTHGDKYSAPGAMAAIRSAIDDAAHLTLRMHEKLPDTWYDPHLLIKCSSIEEAKHLAGQTERFLATAGPPGPGWSTAVIYSGIASRPVWEHGRLITKPLSAEERQLIHPHEGKSLHPWMRAKYTRGRCDSRAARILFVVNIGVRGINNWPCLYLVDIARSESVARQVQFDGRPGRLPPHLTPLLNQPDLHEFITTRYYFPDAEGEGYSSLEVARNFLHTMEEKYQNSGLLTWDAVLEGSTDSEPVPLQGTEEPFSLGDRIQVDSRLGEKLAAGVAVEELGDDDLDTIIDTLPPEITDRRRRLATEHLKNLRDPEYRKKLWTIGQLAPVRAVLAERPKQPEEYALQELLDFVLSSTFFPDQERPVHVQNLLAGNQSTQWLVGRILHDYHARHYEPPVAILRLRTVKGQTGIVNRLASDLAHDLLTRGLLPDRTTAEREVHRALHRALCHIFGVFGDDATRNDGPLDHPGYHHKILSPGVQRKIRDYTVRFMMQMGSLEAAARVYGHGDEENPSSAESPGQSPWTE